MPASSRTRSSCPSSQATAKTRPLMLMSTLATAGLTCERQFDAFDHPIETFSEHRVGRAAVGRARIGRRLDTRLQLVDRLVQALQRRAQPVRYLSRHVPLPRRRQYGPCFMPSMRTMVNAGAHTRRSRAWATYSFGMAFSPPECETRVDGTSPGIAWCPPFDIGRNRSWRKWRRI